MLRRVFEMGATQVREVMIPRTEVTAIDIDTPFAEILSVVRKTSYSRIPVYRETFDNILGILNAKDLLQHLDKPGGTSLRVLLRPVHFVPDTARLDPVLRRMQRMHVHLAVVVDEFGGVEGIVTLEDLLEEIVGEIRDEHDVEPESIRELGPGLFSVAGNLPVREFNRGFHAKVPESREYTTIAGFLQTLTGRMLQQGENVRYQELNFTIERLEGFKVISVRVAGPALKTR
jgi:putative hemolysin